MNVPKCLRECEPRSLHRAAAALACAWLAVAAPVRAENAVESRGERWFSLGLLAGSTQPGGSLADYQWEVSPHFGWGVQSLAGLGPWAGGLRVWQTQTTQSLDATDPSAAAAVRATTVEVAGVRRVAGIWGVAVLASGSAGRLHLGYHPDRIVLQAGGSGVPIEVSLAPVDAWVGGGGVAFQRALPGAWTTTLDVERRFFRMDTAHRNGDAIEIGHDTFGDWSARLELAWAYRRR